MLKAKLIDRAIKKCKKYGVELTLTRFKSSEIFNCCAEWYEFRVNGKYCTNVSLYKLILLNIAKSKTQIQYILDFNVIGEEENE